MQNPSGMVKENVVRQFNLFILFVFSSVSLALPVHAELYINEPPGKTNYLFVKRAYEDDDYDTSANLYPDSKLFYVRVANMGRRFTGVYIDGSVQGGEFTVVDNGQEDSLIVPCAEVVSWEAGQAVCASLASWFEYLRGDEEHAALIEEQADEYLEASRAYVLPVPPDLPPGELARFRVSVLGPAISTDIPDSVIENPEKNALAEDALYRTYIDLFLVPYIAGLTGLEGAEILRRDPSIVQDFLNFAQRRSKLKLFYEQKDYFNLVREVFYFLEESDHAWVILRKSTDKYARFQRVLDNLADITETWQDEEFEGIERVQVIIDMLVANWEDQFNVNIIAPRIDGILPKDASGGDSITIKGIGFDQNEQTNNTVWVTRLNANQIAVPVLLGPQAFHVTSPYEITATLPSDFTPGWIQVDVDDLLSNKYAFPSDFNTTVRITEPANQSVITGNQLDVGAMIMNPPSNFPEIPATRSYYIDNVQVTLSSSVQMVEFYSSLPIETLQDGLHTLRVDVQFDGNVASDSIQFYKSTQAVIDVSQFNRVRVTFNTSNPYTINEGDVDYDSRETSLTDWGHAGSFEGDKYTLRWSENGAGNVQTSYEIDVWLNTQQTAVTDIIYKHVEDDLDEESVYYLEEYFRAYTVPLDDNQTDRLIFGINRRNQGEGNVVCDAISAYYNFQRKNEGYLRVEDKGTCDASTILTIEFFIAP